MISQWKADEIKRLLGDGRLSQRRIALLLDVSRGTVSAIARGERTDYGALRRKRNQGFIPPSGPLRRCPGCGGKVSMPCLACHLRAIAKNRGRPISKTDPPGHRMASPWTP